MKKCNLSLSEHYAQSQLSELEARIADLEAENERLVKAIESLTPGGSEFFNDPDRCIDFLKHLPKMNVKLKLKNKRLREQNDQFVFATVLLVKELNELKDEINISP